MSHQPSTSSGPSSSSYTKYASLPDVDTSAPDVYESSIPSRSCDPSRAPRSSRKQASTSTDDFDSDSSSDDSDRSANRKHPGDGKLNEDIDATSLKRTDAAAKFSGATDLAGDEADSSGRLEARRARKTRPRDAGLETSTYVIYGGAARGGAGEKESAVDRLRRLKFEASQLEEELSGSTAGSAAEGLKEQVDGAQVVTQLKMLQDQLAKLPPDSSTASSSSVAEKDLKSLLQQVKQPRTAASASATSDPVPSAAATVRGSSTDLVALESRLSKLESTLGLPSALLDDSHPLPLPILSTLSRLEHQLSLLSQPRHLDAISRRVKVLVTEMDRVHDVRRKLTDTSTSPSSDPASTTTTTTSSSSSSSSASASPTPAEITKLQHLFEVSTRLEPLLPIIPGVLNRLETLSELHTSAAHFGTALDELEDGKEQRLGEEKEFEELLGRMEKNMAENRVRVEGNLEALQGRIEGLTQRLEKLS